MADNPQTTDGDWRVAVGRGIAVAGMWGALAVMTVASPAVGLIMGLFVVPLVTLAIIGEHDG